MPDFTRLRRLLSTVSLIGVGIVLIVIGCIMQFSQKSEKAEATVLAYKSDCIEVEFQINGETTIGRMTTYSGSPEVGDKIQITYDPEDPSEVSQATSFTLYIFFGVGGVLLIIGIIAGIKAIMTFKAIKSEVGGEMPGGFAEMLRQTRNNYYGNTNNAGNADRATGAETGNDNSAGSSSGERDLLFYVAGYNYIKEASLETTDRQILYEAVCQKHRLLTADDFNFVNHITGRTTPHKVGKPVEIGDGYNGGVRDNSFLYDGDNIWDILERNGGIDVSSDITADSGLGLNFTVTRRGQLFAKVNALGFGADTPDEKRLMFKIKTNIDDEDIGLLFLTVFSIGHG